MRCSATHVRDLASSLRADNSSRLDVLFFLSLASSGASATRRRSRNKGLPADVHGSWRCARGARQSTCNPSTWVPLYARLTRRRGRPLLRPGKAFPAACPPLPGVSEETSTLVRHKDEPCTTQNKHSRFLPHPPGPPLLARRVVATTQQQQPAEATKRPTRDDVRRGSLPT